MLKAGGRPGPIQIPDAKITKAILRPGVIQWDDKTDTGVSFNMRKDGGGQGIPSISNLNLSKILQSRYVQQDIKQGRDVREFAPVGPPAAPAAPKAPPAKAKAKAEAVATVKAAAKVEAKATKEKALSGLGYYFGDAASDAADAATAAATAADKAAAVAIALEKDKAAPKSKMLLLGVVAVAAVGGYLWWKNKA
jgi:cobalamin biosynthesis Mg chelatase CobN